tara:strand:+ start:5323 stop:6579 length:1257 start_codon:yes stop_codon:yes gene_type:complete
MPEFLILVSILVGLVMLYLYKSIIKLPMIMYLFLTMYNTLPYMSYYFFGGDIYFADYLYVDYAFLVFVTGLVAFLLGCLSTRFITRTTPYSNNPPVEFANLQYISFIIFGAVLAGVVLTGQINHIGSYGGGDPAHARFSTLLHFTLIFNIMFSIYIYLLSNGIDKKYIKYQTLILFILFLVIGNRSVVMGLVLSSAWYVSNRSTNIIRDVVALGSMFLVLVAVQTFRGAGHVTGTGWVDGMWIVFNRFQDIDIWVYLMSIQSDNFGVISYVIGRMETIDYFYGYTYLESLVRLIPGFIRSLAGIDDEGEIFNHVEFLGYDGIAFSLMAELYMNFGHLGVIILMFIIGTGVAYVSDMADKKKGLYLIFMLNMYTVISTLTRNDSALSIKQFVYTAAILAIVLAVSIRTKKNRGGNENRG